MEIISKDRRKVRNLVSIINIGKEERILIKPNIVSSEPYPTTTDHSLLDMVLDALRYHSHVEVADAPAPPKKFFQDFQKEFFDLEKTPSEANEEMLNYMSKIVKNSDLAKVCDEHGIHIRELHNDFDFKNIEEQGIRLKMVNLDNFDRIISLPIFKLHTDCEYTGARKNLFGLVDYFDRVKFHFLADKGEFNFMKLIDDLPLFLGNKKIFTILDANLVQSAERPYNSMAVEIYELDGGLITGENIYEVDTYALNLLKRKKITKNYRYKAQENYK